MCFCPPRLAAELARDQYFEPRPQTSDGIQMYEDHRLLPQAIITLHIRIVLSYLIQLNTVIYVEILCISAGKLIKRAMGGGWTAF